MAVDVRRLRSRNTQPTRPGPVVYWMQRDQRVAENWALLYACEQAASQGVPLVVVFNLVPAFGLTTLRHYDFMFRGLAEVEAELVALNIPFFLFQGAPTQTLPAFVREHQVGEVVTDFNPLRFTDAWRDEVGKLLPVALTEVDAHNIVPCWEASPKAEFAAYTFRPKIQARLRDFLTSFPSVYQPGESHSFSPDRVDWSGLLTTISTDRTVPPVTWLTPGTQAGKQVLAEFLAQRLEHYEAERNDPNASVLSNLSPYLHFGQVGAHFVYQSVVNAEYGTPTGKAAFLEELLVRRELADNFCYYTPAYDTLAGAHAWAQQTHREHADDPREFVYSLEVFEAATTHDELWNAMQRQLQREGKMHGWCRMYWAKKILEWTPDVATAIHIALTLNDRYELDGTDPNGIVGVMWSICGVHDRAWTERPVFGKIRYMNYQGARRKFRVDEYIARYTAEPPLFHE